jgi:hypothetical protein
MMAKFARYHGIGGGWQISPARAAPSNDNNDSHVLRRVFSGPQRTPKRVLTCHWRVRPQTGALECVWEAQAVKRLADAVIDEDQIRRPGGRAQRLRCGFVAGATDRAVAA